MPEPLFDSCKTIDIKLQSADGIKKISVRFPTDEEWIERQRRRKVIIKQLGRGASETIIPDSDEIDAELVAKLRDGDAGPEVDGFEAMRILEQLSQAEVDDVVAEEGAFRVFLRVPGALTQHLLEIPSAKDVIHHRKAFARVVDLQFNKQSLSVNLQAAADLYKKLSREVKGYAGDVVPIIHQAAAVQAAIGALESGLGVAEPENF
jgi:hypothetical protein